MFVISHTYGTYLCSNNTDETVYNYILCNINSESKMKHHEHSFLGNNQPNTFTGTSQIRMENTGFMKHFHETKRNDYQQSWPYQVVCSLLFLNSCLKIRVANQIFLISYFNPLVFKNIRSFENNLKIILYHCCCSRGITNESGVFFQIS